ncbi:MAG TPA: hypothetical protein VHR47_07985, partial [Bacillota bacterium]|nr:hypothetical protein [Bacillota bacterium]
ARVMRVAIRPRPVKVRVNGLMVLRSPSHRLARLGLYRRDPWGRYQFIGKITKGMTLTITLPANQKADLMVMDQIDGLPLFGEKLRKIRPSDILPTDNGDVTLLAKMYRIGP